MDIVAFLIIYLVYLYVRLIIVIFFSISLRNNLQLHEIMDANYFFQSKQPHTWGVSSGVTITGPDLISIPPWADAYLTLYVINLYFECQIKFNVENYFEIFSNTKRSNAILFVTCFQATQKSLKNVKKH